MKIEMANEKDAMALVKRMVFLAWSAVGGPSGMGFLQDAGPGMTEDQVWDRAYQQGDYCIRHGKADEVHCDYVFGRMMKWRCSWLGSTLTTPDIQFKHDYQAFKHRYKDNEALVAAALASLGLTPVQVTP